MSIIVDTFVLGFGIIYYAILVTVFILRAYKKSEQELKLKLVFSAQLLPFTSLIIWNLLFMNDSRRVITLLPMITFLVYDLWYRALTEKKPVHHPDKWPRELILYLILLFVGSIGLNWYGYLVSEQYGMTLVVAFFVMMGSYGLYQTRYNKEKRLIRLESQQYLSDLAEL